MHTVSLRTFLGAIALCALLPFSVFAQDAETQTTDEAAEEQQVEQQSEQNLTLRANAGEDRNAIVGRTVLFDGSATTVPAGTTPSYQWDFGDGTTAEGIDATHTYNSSGVYRVNLTVTATSADNDEEDQVSTAEIVMSVQERLALLITDQSVSDKQVEQLQEYGLTQGVLVIPVRDTGVDQEYQTIQNLASKILKRQEDVVASDIIMTWTAGNVGLLSLSELSRIAALNDISLEQFAFASKAVVVVSNDQSLITSAKTAQSTYQSLLPKYILVAEDAVLDDAIRLSTPDALERSLSSVDADYKLITQYTARGLEQLGPLNFMSYSMNYMINKGVPAQSLFLILMLPVMATIIAAARQLVGIKAIGIFVPTVIALSFLATGLKYGIAVFVAIIILGTIARLIARRFRLLYLPRMALVMSLLAIAIFMMFLVGAYFDKTGFIAISIFPILIMTVLTEHFVSLQVQQGNKNALFLTAETLLLSVIGFWIGDATVFKTILLAYPELVLLTLPINYFMGKFSGLRLTEYLRFRSVFQYMRDSEQQK